MKYFNQLNTVRAIAVILVIISHWVNHYNIINRFPNGGFGVNTFFVLSGFLITRILLFYRLKDRQETGGNFKILRMFYVRRFLRIFPIYYLFVLVIFIFHRSSETQIQTTVPYYLTYTSNYLFFATQRWDGILAHLWSLAVEEQFYLIWPWIMLFVGRKYLLHTIILFIVIGIGGQYFFLNHKMGDILTFCCFDAFGMGALLAWVSIFNPAGMDTFYKKLSWLTLLVVILGTIQLFGLLPFPLPSSTLIAEIALWAITYIVSRSDRSGPALRWFLNNPFMTFMGKISYGIYLYHTAVAFFMVKIYNHLLSQPLVDGKIPVYLKGLNFILLLLISWLSWIIIEKPILNLKQRFIY